MGTPCFHYRLAGKRRSKGRGAKGQNTTHVGAEHARVLAVVGDHDPGVGHVGEDLLTELARAAALDGVEVGVNPGRQ
jgi:hypothetical protein